MCGCDDGCRDNQDGCGCGVSTPRVERFVVPCVLLLLKKHPAHGYELVEELNRSGFLETVPDPAVVYRHLRRLEEDGIITPRLEPGSGGPARKVYSLTPEGENYLQAWGLVVRTTTLHLEKFLEAFAQHFPLEEQCGGIGHTPDKGA